MPEWPILGWQILIPTTVSGLSDTAAWEVCRKPSGIHAGMIWAWMMEPTENCLLFCPLGIPHSPQKVPISLGPAAHRTG